jgi:bifunctional ADP-heptose synthase (sugar kinase/adenylyltransferase)
MFEAANLANNAAGIVVGKVGTATANAEELIASFDKTFVSVALRARQKN